MVSFYNETEREKGRFIAVISIDKWYYLLPDKTHAFNRQKKLKKVYFCHAIKQYDKITRLRI